MSYSPIEIVTVLILLGILSTTVIPKYFDLQAQAQKRAAEQVLQTLQAEVNAAFAEALLNGQSCRQFVASLGGGGDSSKTSEIFKNFVINFNLNSKDFKINVDNRVTGFFLYLGEKGGTNNTDDKQVGKIIIPQCN